MMDALVHTAREGPVATLTLDSPYNRNALSVRLLDKLAELGSALRRGRSSRRNGRLPGQARTVLGRRCTMTEAP
jgi:enoyl-CoA hydratase/carnithine racemase